MNDIPTIITIFLLALIPTIIWFTIFNRENPERISSSIFAIFAGGLSTLPVLFYQKFWGQEGNFIFFKLTPINFQDNIISFFGFTSFATAANATGGNEYYYMASLALFSAFLGVGFIEEFFKHMVINARFLPFLISIGLGLLFYYVFVENVSLLNVTGVLLYLGFLTLLPRFIKFKSIDDVISISILAAIGFSFVENIIYFWYKFESLTRILGIDSITEIGAGDLIQFLSFVFIRVSVVTMIHVLCSGVFGYHFGLAHFAKPELVEEIRQGRKHFFTDFLHRLFKTPEDKVFMYEQVIIAMVFSIILHGIYDLVVQVNTSIFGISLIVLVMPLYFFGGFVYLFKLLEDKNNQREIGVLHIKEEYV